MATLVIEDVRVLRVCNSYPLCYAADSIAAINYFKSPLFWDEVYFDHDAGGEGIGAKTTFMPAVDYLVQRAMNKSRVGIGKILIHTMNPVGRKNIFNALSKIYDKIEIIDCLDYFCCIHEGNKLDYPTINNDPLFQIGE